MKTFLSRHFDALEYLVLLGVLLIIFGARIERVGFQRDESHWIATSPSFEAYFTGRVGSPIWEPSYWTRTQPPLARYVIGLGRRMGGYRADEVNEPWNFREDEETNIAKGALPNEDLLWWSRFPMAVLAALCGILLFYLLRRAVGRGAGYIFLLLYIGNPYFQYILVRAMGEAPLVTGVLLALIASDRALRGLAGTSPDSLFAGKTRRRALQWFLAMGACAGLAGAAKLNGLSAAFSGLFICAVLAFRYRPLARTVRRFILMKGIGIGLGAGLTFLALNPYLYPHPLRNSARMFTQRIYEMRRQIENVAGDAIVTFRERVAVVPQRIFEEYAAISFEGSLYLNAALTLIGISFLVRASYDWYKGRSVAPTGLVLLTMAAAVVPPTLMTPLDWDRYYLFPVLFSTLCIAVTLSWGAHSLVERVKASVEST